MVIAKWLATLTPAERADPPVLLTNAMKGTVELIVKAATDTTTKALDQFWKHSEIDALEMALYFFEKENDVKRDDAIFI